MPRRGDPAEICVGCSPISGSFGTEGSGGERNTIPPANDAYFIVLLLCCTHLRVAGHCVGDPQRSDGAVYLRPHFSGLAGDPSISPQLSGADRAVPDLRAEKGLDAAIGRNCDRMG